MQERYVLVMILGALCPVNNTGALCRCVLVIIQGALCPISNPGFPGKTNINNDLIIINNNNNN